MTLAATFMAIAGVAGTFFTREILIMQSTTPDRGSVLVVQLAGGTLGALCTKLLLDVYAIIADRSNLGTANRRRGQC